MARELMREYLNRTEENRLLRDTELGAHICHGRNDEAKSMLNIEIIKADRESRWLHFAVYNANVVITQELINLGSDVNALSMLSSITPLMLAASNRKVAIVKMLLEANADIEIVDSNEKNVLQRLLEDQNSYIILQLILQKMQSLISSDAELVEKLIENGLSLYHVALLKDIKILELMLDRGFDINSGCQWQQTALHAATELADLRLVEWLVEKGADVNRASKYGATPLFKVASDCNKEMIKFLLEKGADPCHPNIHGGTVLSSFFAHVDPKIEESLFVECLQLLLQHSGSLPNSVYYERTIFDRALIRNFPNATNALIAHSAMLDMLGDRPSSRCYTKKWEDSLTLNIDKYYEDCQQVLTVTIFNKLSLIDLLTQSEREMSKIVRNALFVPAIEEVCSEYKLSELYSYYYNTLKIRILNATMMANLEDKAIMVLSKIFNSHYNLCYEFGRRVVQQLTKKELQQACVIYN